MTGLSRPDGVIPGTGHTVERTVVAARPMAGDRWHLIDYSRLVDDEWHPAVCGDVRPPVAWQAARQVPLQQRCVACQGWPQGTAL